MRILYKSLVPVKILQADTLLPFPAAVKSASAWSSLPLPLGPPTDDPHASSVTERLCTYSDDDHNERGKPTPEYLELYRVWGEGEIGTIVLGNIPVDRTHLEGKGNAVIDKRNVSPKSPFLTTDQSETYVLLCWLC